MTKRLINKLDNYETKNNFNSMFYDLLCWTRTRDCN